MEQKLQEPSRATHSQKVTASKPKPNRPWNPNEKADLAVCLGRVFDLQRQYGKTPSQLETIVEGFAWALADFSVSDVIKAIGKYVASNPDIPTPSDIRNIIEPPRQEWRPDWEVYRSLKKMRDDQGSFVLSDDESMYIQACESHSITALKQSRGN